ncbi:MAG: hypothetical protein WAK10_05360, partial [Methanoregula sp.]
LFIIKSIFLCRLIRFAGFVPNAIDYKIAFQEIDVVYYKEHLFVWSYRNSLHIDSLNNSRIVL